MIPVSPNQQSSSADYDSVPATVADSQSTQPIEITLVKGERGGTSKKIMITAAVALVALVAIVTVGILASYGVLGAGAQGFMQNSWSAISGFATKSWAWVTNTAAPAVANAFHTTIAKVSTWAKGVWAWAQNNTATAIGAASGAAVGVITFVAIATLGILKIRKNKSKKAEQEEQPNEVKKSGPNCFRRIWTKLSSLSVPNPSNLLKKTPSAPVIAKERVSELEQKIQKGGLLTQDEKNEVLQDRNAEKRIIEALLAAEQLAELGKLAAETVPDSVEEENNSNEVSEY